MYGQGNYASGPPFQQRPPPPPLQQGPPSSRPPIYQHGQPPHQPVQSSGINLGQPYINRCPPPPPPPSMQVHGSNQVPQYYSTGQHHSQWAQNMFQIRPEIPTSESGNAVQPSFQGQGPSSNSLPPPPYNSNSYPMSQVSQLPPPPLPTSLPQSISRPLALPRGTSTSPAHEVQFSAGDLGQSCSNDLRRKKKGSDFVDRVTTPNQSVDNLPGHGNSLVNGGETSSSLQHDSLTDADTSRSPSNSDMDMEDDITHPAEDESTCLSNFNHGSSSEPVTNSQTAVEHDNVPAGLSKDHESGSKNSVQISDSSIVSKESELPLNSLTHQSSRPHDVSDQCSLSVDLAGKDFEKSANHTTQKVSPLNLLGDYSSDDSAENSEAHVRPARPEVASLLPRDGTASFSIQMENNSSDDREPKNLLNSGKDFDPLVESSGVFLGLLESNVKSQSDNPEADIGSSTARDFENSTDQKSESLKASKVGSSLEATKDDATAGISQKEELKITSGMAKVDEFGRLVREDHSDIDSPDSPRFTRRRSKRGRSRSWSRSPVRGRSRSRSRSPRGRRSSRSRSPRGRRSSRSRSPRGRRSSRSRSPRGRRSNRSRSPRGRRSSRSRSPHGRRSSRSRSPTGRSSRSRSPRGRSPQRRRGRYGRSRSFSPKRFQSRSKSPSYRRRGETGIEKTRRQKAQLPECLDYNRGKCYRGASCRYLHRQSDKTSDRLRSSQMKQQNDVLPISKSSNVYGDTDPMSPYRSVQEHKEHDESQNFKQEVISTGEGRGAVEELCDGPRKLPYPETPIGAPVHLDTDTKVPSDISNCQTQLTDGQGQTSTSVQSQLPSRPYLNKDSLSTLYGHQMSTEQPFASESTMPQSYLPELSPSVGNHSSNLLVGNSTTFTNHIPKDHNFILQHPQFPPPSTTTWNSLPPPPPLPFPLSNNSIGNTSSGFPSAQFQQNIQPLCSNFSYQASTGLGQPVMYPQLPEPHKSLYDANRFGPMIMPVVSRTMDQIHGPSSHTYPYMHQSPYTQHPAPDGVPAHYGSLPAADQYDPLSDSIEPSSSSVQKPDISQMLPTGDSGVVLRTSGFNPLLDAERNNKLQGSVGGDRSLSLENDDYGETADAEVGDVFNGSASNPQSAADMAAEEDEINQDKASGKIKKGKDSKSMKLFKIAIADFVKEVLKPSWRQGNMSKEAFKTIVKKTVDKVSAATGNRHIPKSQEKIGHYIDSQQRKLTKLVMGYVDKYVNA